MQGGSLSTTTPAPAAVAPKDALTSSLDQIHVTVSLPPLASGSKTLSSMQRTSLRLQRNAGSAVRVSNTPPIPPPRPESTISAWTRDLPNFNPAPISAAAATAVVDTSKARVQPVPSNITLTAPRPGNDRVENLYVDAPLKPLRASSKPLLTSSCPPSTVIQLPLHSSTSSTLKKKTNLSDPFSSSSSSSIVTSSENTSSSESGDSSDAGDSIICRNCGRCRCLACRTPKKLPERWICGNKCHLSAESIVDTLSCLCLVKAGMYHVGKDLEESNKSKSWLDSPCSFSADHMCARWTCLGLSSLVLPCLCFYWPLKGCTKAAEKVYRHVKATGCECEEVSNNNQDRTVSPSSSEVIIKKQPFRSSSPSSPFPFEDSNRKQSIDATAEKRLLG